MNATVLVVIPNYNKGDLLARALRSLLDQSFRDWEAIVVDNHSTDTTDTVLSQFTDSRIYSAKIHNGGVIASSRNMGIDFSHSKYVAFLDSDDWWRPEKLGASIDQLEKGADLVYHKMRICKRVRQRLYLTSFRSRRLKADVHTDFIENGNCICTSSVVMKRSVLDEVGVFDTEPNLRTIEDFDLWLRVAEKGFRFSYIPNALGYYWAGGGNTLQPNLNIVSLMAIRAKHLSSFEAWNRQDDRCWFYYSIGRSYYRLGDFVKAREYLTRYCLIGKPLHIVVKTLYMLARIVFPGLAASGRNA